MAESASASTLWSAIDVPLPPLPYKDDNLLQQDKGSTAWAAHSHTPCSVKRWIDFDDMVAASARNSGNCAPCNTDVGASINRVRLKKVSREQHVTNNTDNILQAALEDVLPEIEFAQTDEYALSSPDIVALREEVSLIESNEYQSPANRPKARAAARERMKNAALLTFETKPFWKFRFLMNSTDSTQELVDLWCFPEDFSAEDMKAKRSLPKNWSHKRKKTFHLIRQLHGQMVSSRLRYGILHLYDIWWFCRHDVHGNLEISRPFRKEEKSPSVLQAIVTLLRYGDHYVSEISTIHPMSAVKARDAKPKASGGGRGQKRGAQGERKSRKRTTSNDNQKQRPTKKTGGLFENLASSIQAWDCDIVDMTEHVKLLTSKSSPHVLIKLQRDPFQTHVSKEMKREACIYEELSKNDKTKKAIAPFYGFSDHMGVSLLCTEQQGPDFEDIGVESLSDDLKVSAVECLYTLSQAGLLHNDIALRNVVQCRMDPNKAKIIDFGKAEFTNDVQLLQEQVVELCQLLQMNTAADWKL